MTLYGKQLLLDGVSQLIGNGMNTTVKFINYTFASGDYDDVSSNISIAGSQIVSGLIFPIRGQKGSQEAMLLEEGKLKTMDKAIYFDNSLVLNGSSYLAYIGSDVFSIIPDGVFRYELNGSTVYQKLFLRRSTTGSLYI